MRKRGPLTWGVCRQDLRTPIAKDSIVVFFSFTAQGSDKVSYRLCAVETVTEKLDHRAIHRNKLFSRFRHLYINGLIRPQNDGWLYDETDRGQLHRHRDGLWRLSDHNGMTKHEFNKKYASIYQDDGWFSDSAVASGELRLACNYVVFSARPNRGFISPNPPKGHQEDWIDRKLQTVGKAASLHPNRRHYLRAANPSNQNVHRQIKFQMPADEAGRWRDALIVALKQASDGGKKRTTNQARLR